MRLHVCICFVYCAYVASAMRIVEELLSGSEDQKLNRVTMTPDTSTSTPAACSVSPSSPAALLSISLDLLHVVFLLLSLPASFSFSLQSFI